MAHLFSGGLLAGSRTENGKRFFHGFTDYYFFHHGTPGIGNALDHMTEKALLVLSIGAGVMSVSNANNSYFWVINQYSGLSVGTMYRYITMATFLWDWLYKPLACC